MERQLSAAPESTDEELAAAVSAGDRQAFGTLYERYFRGLYDLSIRMMRDRDAAADNVQNTFLNAWQSLKQRTVSGNVRAWLYTIARNNAINELRRRNRLVPLQLPDTRDAPARDYAQVDGAKFSNPAEVLEDRELVDLVWNSAAALSPREYSLLDLQLRKGLSNEEMAQSLGVPRSNIYVMLSRLRDSLEESVTVALLARRGRADCAELDAILGPQSGSGVRPDLRRAVRRHIAECPACQQSRRRYLAAAEIFSGLALFPVDQDMAAAVWFRISALSGAGAAIFAAFHWGLQQAGSLWPRLRWPALGMGATGAAVASLVIVALIFSGGGNSEPETAAALLAATGRPAVAHSPSVSATPSPTPTEAPTEVPTSAPVVAGVVKAPAQAPAPHRTLPPPVAAPTPNATPGLQPITINIRLGNSPNGLNLTSSQTLAAVVLDTDSFAAGSVDIATVRLGGAPVARSQPRDTNGDGRIDLLLYFDVGQTSIPADSPWVCLSGSTISGQRFAGCDTITMLGSP